MSTFTLKVKKQHFKNLQSKKEGYVSRAISNGVVDFADLCKAASANTTLHPKELELAFGLALDAVRDALTEGKIVVLDQIGRLYPAVSSKWTEKADQQDLGQLVKRVAFRPSQAIITAINGAKLVWATDKEAAEADKAGTTTPTTGGNTGGTTINDDGDLEQSN